jgi:formylglycine-generating enzyme required for sulfatase activity
MTGTPPERGPDGKLVLKEESGVVLVLLPGGTFSMGAQSDDRNGQNHDSQARSDEGPVHEVELTAFFLSKYEMTQGQWQRLTGNNPSIYQPPHDSVPDLQHPVGRSTLLHPVETVSWADCMEWLPRGGLALPSEAQWEYGARGGTDTPWWTGADRESLRYKHAANLADKAAAQAGASWSDIKDWPELDDGYAAHAPVGTFAPNGFGLHDVTGNVWEWCLDGYDAGFYGRSPRINPVAPRKGAAPFVMRGGGFARAALTARSAYRGKGLSSRLNFFLGVRPARAIDP